VSVVSVQVSDGIFISVNTSSGTLISSNLNLAFSTSTAPLKRSLITNTCFMLIVALPMSTLPVITSLPTITKS